MEVFWLEQAAGDVPLDDDWLSAGEQRILAGMKVPKRRADWRLGRWAAKQVVAAHRGHHFEHGSLSAIEIRPAASGAPEVFLRGEAATVSISLSHSNGNAACALAQAGGVVGCDLEAIETRSEIFIADYFTAEEQSIITRSSNEYRDLTVAVLWSAKESALKALAEGLRLDTRSVSAWFENNALEKLGGAGALAAPCTGWSELRVRHGNEQMFSGWWRSAGRLVRTVVSVPAALPPISLKNIFAANS